MHTPIETTAVMELTPGDWDALVEEVRASHAISSPLGQRRAPRAWAGQYWHAWLLERPRTASDPLVLALAGGQPQAVRAMPHCLREGRWDDTALLHRHGQEVGHAVGAAEGGLSLEGRAVPQQGQGEKMDSWNRSALEAATLSMTRWVRVAANMHLGAYDVL
jgi:hypothetical protein